MLDQNAETLSEYTEVADSLVPSPESEVRLGEAQDQVNPLDESLAGRRFHNAREPFYTIQHERPEHRVILYLKAEGHSNREIAEITGFTTVAISNIVRQPWAQQEILRIIQSHGESAVEKVLKGTALDSVYKLIELRDSGESPKETQRKAANDLLDRMFGKPNQPVQHSGNLDLTKLSDEELAKFVNSGGGSTATATTGS